VVTSFTARIPNFPDSTIESAVLLRSFGNILEIPNCKKCGVPYDAKFLLLKQVEDELTYHFYSVLDCHCKEWNMTAAYKNL